MKKILHFILFLSCIGPMTAQTPSNLWTPQGIGLLPAGSEVASITVVNKDVVWAIGGPALTNPLSRSYVSKVLKTTNGGTTWQSYDLTIATGRAGLEIYALDATTAFITTNSLGNGLSNDLYKTTDGGATWTFKTTGYEASLFIRFFDAQYGFIWNRHRIASTLDGGTTWNGTGITLFASNESFASASINNSCAVIGDSIWAGTSISRMAFSPDRGATWQLQNLQSVPNFGTSVYILAVAFKDAKNGIALGWNSTTAVTYLAKTANGGTSWTNITTYPFTLGSTIEYVRGTNGTYIIADNDPGLTVYTTNAGQSWVKIDDSRGDTYRFLNPQTGWVGRSGIAANSPAFYKWNGGNSLVKVFEPEEVSLKISPNPTSRYLTVSYSSDFKPTELTLYDLRGATVFQKKDPSVFSQVIDLEGLANGIYLLQLKNTEGVVAAQKVVVER